MLLPQIEFLEPASVAEARTIQQSLRDKVRLVNDMPDPVRWIAGIDVGYDPQRNESRASIAVIDTQTLMPVEQIQAHKQTTFPYVPGLLSFREIPVILDALSQLKAMPDLLMVDGQGIAHPRRMGIAAHLGVLLDQPAIGVAKSVLTGQYKDPALDKGAMSPLMDGTEKIGTVLRSRTNVKPLIISPGHRVDHDTAVHYVLAMLTRYRLPEPTRLADKLSKYKHAHV